MLKASELFERLHNEGVECKGRERGGINSVHELDGVTHLSSYSHNDKKAPTGAGSFRCGCAVYHMGTALGLKTVQIWKPDVAEGFNMPISTVDDIEAMYETGRTFGEIADHLKKEGF